MEGQMAWLATPVQLRRATLATTSRDHSPLGAVNLTLYHKRREKEGGKKITRTRSPPVVQRQPLLPSELLSEVEESAQHSALHATTA